MNYLTRLVIWVACLVVLLASSVTHVKASMSFAVITPQVADSPMREKLRGLRFQPADMAATFPQTELRYQVSAAARLFPKEAERSRKQLISFGEAAIPLIVEIIQTDMNLDPIKKGFLIDVIARIHGEQSGEGFVSLLSDPDPFVRGFAVSYIGKRKLQTAIPQLIALLEDTGIYKTVVETDPTIERPILVRDVSIEALQSITARVLGQHSSREKQAKAFQTWWGKQQNLKKKSKE